MMENNIFVPQLGLIRVNDFSGIYPAVNKYIYNNVKNKEGRDGKIKEILDVKTQLLNPYRRCVGGYGRNINIFFLLAEAMWIATGKKDVKFLTLFNKKMANFSDDGETFHAPYGYRLRHYGMRTEDKFLDDKLDASKGYDQVMDAIRILTENPNTRQVVLAIWNPNLDLGFKTKDIPCNDLVMLKIRDGKLITTIQNRSNDLHWGLPTNIFQFSFLTELISSSLGIELGTQTHNSQSLHIYDWNKISEKMDKLYSEGEKDGNKSTELYKDYGAEEKRIDFNFSHEVPVNRFMEIDFNLNYIINNLTRISEGESENESEIKQLKEFSKTLHAIYLLLAIYLRYKIKIDDVNTDLEKDMARKEAIKGIELIEINLMPRYFTMGKDWDVIVLAKNFFFSRLYNKSEHKFLGKL